MAAENKQKSNAPVKSQDSQNTASNPSNEGLYTREEFVANPGVLGASRAIVEAALISKGITQATVSVARSIVDEFKKRRVN